MRLSLEEVVAAAVAAMVTRILMAALVAVVVVVVIKTVMEVILQEVRTTTAMVAVKAMGVSMAMVVVDLAFQGKMVIPIVTRGIGMPF
ncbi:hypothetical protein IEQ34_018378 [Dendrobium chrysotoxum]|uniref:Uncharacterized protein n=1 Tax=Dendrobium chrysotoxum TaxID=161865 RepID=A0AAV7GEE9_DENCH|nr:hypothetical protein IEQ34_018378 [Dendrobium chrysotoxum]